MAINSITGIRRLNDFSEIPKGNYSGYYWMSDKDAPVQVNGEHNFPITLNPFVIEAMLWDENNKRSIMITHTGRHHIYQYDVEILAKEGIFEEKQYMPHRLDAIKKVKFLQFWKGQPDPECAGFEVLILMASVFTGFEQ